MKEDRGLIPHDMPPHGCGGRNNSHGGRSTRQAASGSNPRCGEDSEDSSSSGRRSTSSGGRRLHPHRKRGKRQDRMASDSDYKDDVGDLGSASSPYLQTSSASLVDVDCFNHLSAET